MTAQKSMSTAAWAGMGLLALLWGGSFLAIEVALRGASVATVVAFRVGGACAVLWAYILLRGLPVPRAPASWGAFLVMGVFNNALPFSLITWGQRSIESGLAAILNAGTAMMGVLVAAAVFRDERLTARKLAGVATGFVGVVTVIGPSALGGFDLASLAQLAILGASLSYACATAFSRVAAQALAPEVAAAGMLTGSSAIMVPVAIWDGGGPGVWTPSVWLSLAYLAFGATALAYLIYYRLLRRVGSGNTSLVTLLVAPVAILLGALILGEALPFRAYLGFALLAAGLAILDGRLLRRPAAPQGDPAP